MLEKIKVGDAAVPMGAMGMTCDTLFLRATGKYVVVQGRGGRDLSNPNTSKILHLILLSNKNKKTLLRIELKATRREQIASVKADVGALVIASTTIYQGKKEDGLGKRKG